MRKNSFMENLAAEAGSRQLYYGEYDALRAYNYARELNLDYPIVFEFNDDTVNVMLTVFKQAHIGKFYYSYPSTCTNDAIASAFMTGWRICDVIPRDYLLGEKSYKTCSKSVLVLKRVD